MADPNPYSRSYSFTGFQTTTPQDPLPAPHVDTELDAIAGVTSDLADAVKDVRRADGALKNGIVTADSLSPGIGDQLVTKFAPAIATAVLTVTASEQVVVENTSAAISSAAAAAASAQAAQNLANSTYTRGAQGTPRQLRDLRRDWTTLYEQGAACDGVTNDWPALQKAFATGLYIDLEHYTYLIDPTVGTYSTTNGQFTIPATVPGIFGNGRAVLRRSTGGNIFAMLDADSNGRSAKLYGWKLKGTWDRSQNSSTSEYGLYAGKSVYGGVGNTTRFWFVEPDWDGFEVEGFAGRGVSFDGLIDPNFRRFKATACGTHGMLLQAVKGGRIQGISDGIGKDGAPMATNVYPLSIARPSAYSNTATLADAPIPDGVTVTWDVKNCESYSAFDVHGGRRITFRDCNTADVGAGINLEHSNQADEAHCRDILIEGGNWYGLSSVSGQYKPGPLLFVDTMLDGNTNMSRGITIQNVKASGFGFMGSNVGGALANWGGVIAAQGVDGLLIDNVDLEGCYGPAVLLYKTTTNPHPVKNCRIRGLRHIAPVDPTNYPGGNPGGSWLTPYTLQVDNDDVDVSIAESRLEAGSYATFLDVSRAQVAGSVIHVGERCKAVTYAAGGSQPGFYTTAAVARVTHGAGARFANRGRAHVRVAAGAITGATTFLPDGWSIAYTGVGTYALTLPAGLIDLNAPMDAQGTGALVMRMFFTVNSATSLTVQTYNAANALFDPTVFWFEVWGSPGTLGT